MAKQLNIFLDNRPGRLKTLTGILHEEEVNIRAMTIQSRDEFGLVKLLVDKPDKAHQALLKKGFACAIKDVLAIVIKDKPGGLYELTAIFSSENINIADAYGFVIESNKKAVFCVEVQDADNVKASLDKKGFKVLSDQELYEL